MNIVVLNGSPKGEISVTMQYVKYLQKRFPMHAFKIINIAHQIKKIENETKIFEEIIVDIKKSDGILWAFLLYFFLVHSNYKRFIELINERHVEEAFKGKYVAAFSTSINFFDHTAHNYIHGICDDLDMNFVGAYSAAMDDIMNKNNRNNFYLFAKSFFTDIEKKSPTTKVYKKLNYTVPQYLPEELNKKVQSKGKKVVVVTDSLDKSSNLGKMINRLASIYEETPEIINISELDIKGGCLGCLHCGFDNICVYDNKDELRSTYENKLKKADVIFFAGNIVDRYFSSRWKTFIDRRFFNTHQRVFIGKQIGYIISGPLKDVPNFRQILEANADMDHANLVGIITDEYEDSKYLDTLIDAFAQQAIHYAVEDYIKPSTFLGVGGMKIFRDEIWGKLRFVFQGDHRSYKKMGFYDFPQKNLNTRIQNSAMILLTKIPKVKKQIQKEFRQLMLQDYKKLLDSEKI
ncbi:MAG: NAD(P)H-dependent oxidoreductase [Ruminiclostridium sp.]